MENVTAMHDNKATPKCESCEYCLSLSSGDYICCRINDLVIENYERVPLYGSCNGKLYDTLSDIGRKFI